MSPNLREIARLKDVLDAAFQAKQARLARVGRRIEAVERKLAGLQRNGETESLTDLSPAVLEEVDMRWRAWVEQRRRSLNVELARLLSEREACRTDLAVAFGKLQAVEGMRARLKEAAHRKARRLP